LATNINTYGPVFFHSWRKAKPFSRQGKGSRNGFSSIVGRLYAIQRNGRITGSTEKAKVKTWKP